MSRSLVHDVTTDNQTPAAGYLLKELAEKSRVSSADSKDIEGYLLKRLDSASPDVRLKALHAIKYLCINGNDEFRISLQRNNELIRNCQRTDLSLVSSSCCKR